MQTRAIFTSFSQNAMANSKRLEETISHHRESLSSGGVAGNYSQLGDVKAFISSEKEIATLQNQSQENKFLLERQKFIVSQVQTCQEVNTKLHQLILMAKDPVSSFPKDAFYTQVTGFLSELKMTLNNKFLEDTTLGGLNITSDAVTTLENLSPLNSSSSMDTNYYLGTNGNFQINISDQKSINLFPITAAHSSFAKTIFACRLCLGSNLVGSPNPELSKALDNVESALGDYSEAISSVAFSTQQIKVSLTEIEYNQQEAIERRNMNNLEDHFEDLLKIQESQATLDISRSLYMQKLQNIKRLSDEIGRF